MINKIKSMILELCKGQEGLWDNHIMVVVHYSKILAEKLGADEEIVEIAAWLHDIKKLKGESKDHHIHGSREVEQILAELGYPKNKIEQVKECILTHSSDEKYPPQTIESKIVASADALAHFDNFAGLSYVVFSKKGLSIEEGRAWLIKKYANAWKKLMPEAKEIANKKYDAIKLLLNVK